MRKFLNPFLSNKGVIFINILVSIVIVLIVVIMLSQFRLFLATSNKHLSKNLLFFETINNKITDIYLTKDWSNMEEEIIETDLGNVIVKYSNYESKTHNLTSRIIVEFLFEDKTREYVLERSIYFGE